MDFEIGHLDMIQSEQNAHNPQAPQHQNLSSSSLILNELQKETEELQNKLKLNNRRLLLFETENSKLIEEKNKLFFEMQNLAEKNHLFIEKLASLENENTELQAETNLLREKNQSFLLINQTQLSELKRFTKFHLKIQNVIKPYIQQLKQTVSTLKADLIRSEKLSQQLFSHKSELEQKIADQTSLYTQKLTSFEIDKNQIISTYEEQIHSFSKEIIHLEHKNEDLAKEVARLKKAVEFKNYFENELIKFKRIHEDDQREILNFKDKLNSVEVRLIQSEQLASTSVEKLKSTENQLMNSEQLLETTRHQLAKQIDHANLLNERLARLEKLNLNLSQQMHQTT